MIRSDSRSYRSAFAVGAVSIAMFVAACGGDPSAPPENPNASISFGKAVSGISVASVKPDSATQDTTLDVVINGSGFVSGAAASWALAGVEDPTQVRTNSTRYVSSRQLVANITVSSTATIASWDIVVRAGSKGGIGTEMFAIKPKGNVDLGSRALLVFEPNVNVAAPGDPVSMAPAGIQGDSRDKYGTAAGFSEYQGNFCGVAARFFWSDTNQSGDLTFDVDMDYSVQRACGPARKLNFHLSYQRGGTTGPSYSVGSFTNIRALLHFAPGEIRSQKTHFNYLGLNDCNRLAFDAEWAGASNVRVARLPDVNGARQWRVESEYPHTAMCTVSKGQNWIARSLKYLPFALTATEIPYPYPTNP